MTQKLNKKADTFEPTDCHIAVFSTCGVFAAIGGRVWRGCWVVVVLHKSVPQDCPTRVSQKSVLQQFSARVSDMSVPQKLPARCYKIVTQDFSTTASWL